jgi:hypothetical protein
MFGDPAQSGSSPYTYIFKVPALCPSFTLETQFTDLATAKYQRFVGCKVNSWGMSFDGDDELVANLDIVGASASMETSPFDATPTAPTFAQLEKFQATLKEGGGAIAIVTELNFNINFNKQTDRYVVGGSGVRPRIPDSRLAIDGVIKTFFDNDTLLAKAIAGTESSLTITITASANSEIEIEFPELQYEKHFVKVPHPQGLEVELPFKAFYENDADATSVLVTLINTTDHGLG